MSAVLTAQEPSAKYMVNLQPPLVRHFDSIAQAPGGVARLRELILTLAVQGKLVPQDPSDEPASELLKKIRTEKDRLIAEGKIKRDKPLAAISDEEKPFDLPESWQWVRVPDIYYSISPSGNKLLSSAVNSEGQYPVVDQGQKYVTGFTDDAGLLIKIPGPVIIFGDHTKAIKYIDFDFVAGADGTKILRPVHHDEKFFAWQLRSFSLEDRGYARHFKVLNSCLFALPPVLEQSRIVTRVEELMQLCDALEANGQLEAQQHAQLAGTLLGTLTQSETPEALADNWQRIATHFDVLLDRPEAVDALEQTILQLAVRGLLVPQDPTDEPASVLLQKIRTEKDHLIAQGKIKRDKPLPPITDEEKPFELPQRISSLTMPIQHAIWQVADQPAILPAAKLASEQLLESMIVREPRILSSEWMLIGQQEVTSHGGRIDLLAIAPDGSLVLIELKRDRTPREIVAQALDYASWVVDLTADRIVQIYQRFSKGGSLQADFQKRFGSVLDEDTLNHSHQIIIVASELDPSTERIVAYLNARDIAINVVFFKVFEHGGQQLLSRAWMIDPGETQANAAATNTAKGETKEPWNGEFYVSFGDPSRRNWDDARKYGYICGGGGAWYSQTLKLLSPGDRVWVRIPQTGYVGVGEVTAAMQSVNDFTVPTSQGDRPAMDVLQHGPLYRETADDPEKAEYFVRVKWLDTVDAAHAFNELGLFGLQHTVCQPRATKWRHTVERLKAVFTGWGG